MTAADRLAAMTLQIELHFNSCGKMCKLIEKHFRLGVVLIQHPSLFVCLYLTFSHTLPGPRIPCEVASGTDKIEIYAH